VPDPDPKFYYVCAYSENGKQLGHIGNSEKVFPENIDDSEEHDKQQPDEPKSEMRDISQQFIHTMMGYLDYVPLILTMAPLISKDMVVRAQNHFFERSCISSEKSDNRVIYTFSATQFPAIRRFQENLEAATSTSRALPRLLCVGLSYARKLVTA
jgi:hypothetical protein